VANRAYTEGKQNILAAATNFDTATMTALLVDGADYTPNTNAAGHDFKDDISAGIEETATLASTTIADGVFDASDTTFTAAAGDPCELIVLYDNTGGADSTDPLYILWDTATGLPVTLNGGDVVVQWNASGIFSL
jgi:hypothetical protein